MKTLLKKLSEERIEMKRILLLGIMASAVFACAGCSQLDELKNNASFMKSSNSSEEIQDVASTTGVTAVVTSTPTPAPVVTEAPAAAPVVPTSTPVPNLIGTKTSQGKYIYLTNNNDKPLREIYLRESGTEDWGKNLIPGESTVKQSETVQMYYAASGSDPSTLDVKVVDKSGNSFAMYGIDFTDIESASFRVQEETGYLSWMSVTSHNEVISDWNETLALDYSGEYGSDESDMESEDYSDWDTEEYYYDDYDYTEDYTEDYTDYDYYEEDYTDYDYEED